jgi:hypothetical protein
MKRLLVVFSILGAASVANATLQISVDGDPEPVDSEITISPSDTLVLDIWTDATIPQFVAGVWMLVCDPTLGSITPGIPLINGFSFGDPPYTDEEPEIIPPPGLDGIWGVYTALSEIPAGTVLYDEIGFHCVSTGDVTLYLLDAPDGEPASTVFDTVVIHQIIPEPVTIALLGLGGLLVLRRRK